MRTEPRFFRFSDFLKFCFQNILTFTGCTPAKVSTAFEISRFEVVVSNTDRFPTRSLPWTSLVFWCRVFVSHWPFAPVFMLCFVKLHRCWRNKGGKFELDKYYKSLLVEFSCWRFLSLFGQILRSCSFIVTQGLIRLCRRTVWRRSELETHPTSSHRQMLRTDDSTRQP